MKVKTNVHEKIRVFISSVCGNEKYDTMRKELKELIEGTGIAKVYVFEGGGASTFTAEQDYLYGVDDSDICVFLIDNADGVPKGVLEEHQRAKAKSKKRIYIFCNEHEKRPTHIQNEISHAQGVKYYTIDNFQEFIKHGYASFINNIVKVYIGFCRGRFIDPEFVTPEGLVREVDISASEAFEKQLFKNIDKTRGFIAKVIYSKERIEVQNTSELDLCCFEFLQVLFGYKSIREVNINLTLLSLESMQSPELHQVVTKRWKAIQYYWLDDLDQAIDCVKRALSLARELQVPNWLIQDILIDLRNLYVYKGNIDINFYINNPAQEELNNEKISLFYPLLDRYEKSFYEEILDQTEKDAIQSPYTITLGNNLNQYSAYISNMYVVAFFNGSLTHILGTFGRIKEVAFYLCSRYSDWEFKVLLLKMSMTKGKQKEIKGLINLFNDVYGKMNASDAREIYDFNSSSPVGYRRIIHKLLCFQHLGYYFSDDDYLIIQTEIIKIIKEWIESEDRIFILASYVFEALMANVHRLDNQIVLEIVLIIFAKGLKRFYDNTFEIIEKINFGQVDNESITALVKQFQIMIKDENVKENSRKLRDAIVYLRKQLESQTEGLHEYVIEYMNDLFQERYYLELLVNNQKDSIIYINRYIEEIKGRNDTQGKDGKYSGYRDNPYEIIINIIDYNDVIPDKDLVREIVDVCRDTLYRETQTLSAKVEAIKLIIFLKTIATEVNDVSQALIDQLVEDEDIIFQGKEEMFMDKTSKRTLYFNFMMMKLVFKVAKLDEIISLLGSYTSLDDYEKLEALKTIIHMLENKNAQQIDNDLMLIIFQFALQLSYDKNHDIRYYASKALLFLINNRTKDSIARRISEIMDFDSAFIKNMILRHLDRLEIYDLDMCNFIKEKAMVDNHYVIRNWKYD